MVCHGVSVLAGALLTHRQPRHRRVRSSRVEHGRLCCRPSQRAHAKRPSKRRDIVEMRTRMFGPEEGGTELRLRLRHDQGQARISHRRLLSTRPGVHVQTPRQVHHDHPHRVQVNHVVSRKARRDRRHHLQSRHWSQIILNLRPLVHRQRARRLLQRRQVAVSRLQMISHPWGRARQGSCD